MTEGGIFIAFYMTTLVFILVLMIVVLFKKYKGIKIARARKKIRLVEGENIEKVRTGH